MPRFKISNNMTYFDILCKLNDILTNYDSVKALNTVNRMICTNKSVLKDVYHLQGENESVGTFKWETILPNDTNVTMYTLDIVDSILKKECSVSDPTYNDVYIY